MTPLRQGRIVWTPVRDRFGNPPKHHPVVIISRDDEIAEHDTVFGVVISHSAAMQDPRPNDYVELPHHPRRLCKTKLNKPAMAVCSWVVEIANSGYAESDIGGFVEPRILLEIIRKVREIAQNSENETSEDSGH